MRDVSDRFLEALRGSHRMAARALLLTSYQEGVDPDGTELVVLSGDVKASSRNDIRCTLDLTVDGTDWDFSIDGGLIPYGNEIFIQRGIVFGGGIREWVSLGYYRIYAVEQEEAPDGQIRIEGRDRMSAVIDSKLEAPVQFVKTRTVTQVFDELIKTGVGAPFPSATIEFDDSLGSTTIGRAVIMEEDRYAGLRDLARAYGKIMYWDHEGVLQIKDPPDPTAAVWDVNAGEAGVLIGMGRKLTREGIYNAVVATSQASDASTPKRGVARDVSVNSPTYYYGDFGKVPRFYSSPFITTTAQAKTAAKNLLIQSIGRPHEVDFSAVPNPALEPLDPVNLNPGTGTEIHVCDDLTIGLTDASPLSGTTRNQLGLEIEEA